MALFESGASGAPATSAPHLSHLAPSGPVMSALSSFENLPAAVVSTPGVGAGGNGGHDRPYRFSFYSNALSATIHSRSLSELPAEDQTFEDMFSGSLGKGGNGIGPAGPNIPSYARINGDGEGHTWWLDVLSPTDEEMKLLSQVFGIHPLTTEDIQTEESREKIELFRTYYLVCFRSFDQDPYSPTHLEPVNMYIIVFREGILSFHFRPTPHPQNVRRRIKQLRDYISVTSDWISYALIDDITDAFGPLIQSIEYEVDSIDELVLILKDAEQSDMLRRIGTCRKKVMGLLRLMGNKADVVKGLAKRCNENWKVAPTGDIGLYLSDIQDHLITMTQNLNHYEKILSRSHSNYLAQISIEMTDANNQINDVLSKLTALGTVLVPMNLITAGLWGMNVHVPGQDIEEGYAWFGAIVGALAAIALIGGYTTYKLMTR
ncbi:cora-domain-containing protein [Peniophora sp. CONT]|nr:cora-domain-containing protein [Peniophora sp. CONT]